MSATTTVRVVLYRTIITVFSITFGAFAQTITTGDLTGTVTDSSNGVIPNATITLKSLGTGETKTAESNAEGAFRFNFLKPGEWQLSGKSPGLQSDIGQVAVTVGQVVTANLVLKVEESKQVVLVTDAAPLIQTDNANLATTFDATQMSDLPAPGSDITTIAFTVPGVVVNTGGGYGNFSSHGLPSTSNLFTINGNDYNDPYLNLNNSGASNLLLGQNEIQEVSVVQNAYSVQYGRNAGAQINYITKSGTNEFHGTAMYNWNGSALNSTDFFNNQNGLPKPHAVSNNWGAAGGGPIKRNKLFFFADTEGLRYVLPFGGYVAYPSPQFQAYTLGNIQPQSVGLYKAAFGEFANAKGAPVTTGNGPTQDSSGSLGCGSFAGTPTGTGGIFGVNVPCAYSYAANANNLNQEWLFTARGDWNINDKERLFVRFKTDHGHQPTGTNLVEPLYNIQSIQPQYEGQINLASTLSSTMVNNLTASVLWYSAIFTSANLSQATATIPASIFLCNDGGINAGGWYPIGVGYQPFPACQVNQGLQTFPQGRNVGQYEIVDDLSKIIGKHNLKVGVNFRRNRVSDYTLGQNEYGVYNFNSVADFANGVTNAANASNYTQNFAMASVVHIRLYNVAFYVQDEWAIKDNLKLTYGLRFERTGDPSCLEDCFSRLNQPFVRSAFTKGINIPYNQSIQTGLGNAYGAVDALNTDPRVGIVWKPGNHANGLVIRAGGGLFSDLAPGGLVDPVLQNQPYLYSADVFSGVAAGLPGTPNTAPASALAQYHAFWTGFSNGATYTQLNNSVPGGFSPINFVSVPNHVSSPQYLEWSVEVEKPFGPKNVLAVTYAGNHGYNLFTSNPWANANNAAGFGGLPTAAPDGRFNAVTQLESNGISNYNGLTVQFRRALSWGFSGQIGYTFSHALDNSSSLPGEPFNYTNSLVALASPYLGQSYSNSDFDIRNSMVADFVWNAPFKPARHMLSWLASNWTVASKFYVRSGTPFTIYDGSLPGMITTANGGNALLGAGKITATPIGFVSVSCGSGAVDNPCLSTSNYVAAGSETTFGMPRNSVYGPGYFDIDMSAYKYFPITERVKFAVGAQFFNLLNHPNFAQPSGDISQPGFGLISSTVGAPTSPYGSFQGSAVNGRVVVLSGRFTF
jgi:Carboxypeptidase regulatory-like domain/TonB-dependent Receptor Plug Domain/TonB dependent receptor